LTLNQYKPVKTVCARHNISEASYYHWKNNYGGMEIEEARKTAGIGKGERAA
jgi:Transposase